MVSMETNPLAPAASRLGIPPSIAALSHSRTDTGHSGNRRDAAPLRRERTRRGESGSSEFHGTPRGWRHLFSSSFATVISPRSGDLSRTSLRGQEIAQRMMKTVFRTRTHKPTFSAASLFSLGYRRIVSLTEIGRCAGMLFRLRYASVKLQCKRKARLETSSVMDRE